MGNGIRNYNTFTVSCGEQVSVSHNRMLAFLPMVFSGRAYGKYIAIGRGEGMTNKKINAVAVKNTEVSEINCDGEQGEIFAVLTARFTDAELTDGEVIKEAGLCPEPSYSLADYAVFEPVTKKQGVDLIVKVEIHLYFDGNIGLVAGENEFVRCLLGLEQMQGAKFSLGVGDNFHPTACFKKTASAIEKVSASVSCTSGSLSFSGVFTRPVYELILYYHDKPVLRSYNLSGVKAETLGFNLDSSRCVEVSKEHLSSITSLRSYGQSVLSYQTDNLVGFVTDDCPSIIERNFSPRVRFLHEPKGAYIAVCGEREISTYAFNEGKARLIYKADAINKKPFLLTDGSLLLVGETSELVFSDGSKVPLAELRATSAVALFSGDKYIIVAKQADGVGVYEYSGGVLTKKESLETGDGCFISRVNAFYIAVCDAEKGVYKTVGIRTNFPKIETTLALCAQNLTVDGMEDCWLYLRDGEMNFIVNMMGEELIENDGKSVCEDYFLDFDEQGRVKAICSTCGGTKEPVFFPFSADEPDDFALLGGYILFLYGGKVRTLYPVPCGRRIFCPDLSDGVSVTLTAVSASVPVVGENGLKVTLTLEQGA